MCGIVGGIAERSVTSILLEGLKRLEYRGYDSAGLAVIDDQKHLARAREVGKVAALEELVQKEHIKGRIGIAHTRWATHGTPTVNNAHPHVSGEIAVVHNGIIENYAELKAKLIKDGYEFTSQTDTEVVAHLVHQAYNKEHNLLKAVQSILPHLHGAYALGIICAQHPEELIAVRMGSPLVLGVGIEENFIASDQLALLPVTNRFIYLEQGDVVHLKQTSFDIYHEGQKVDRKVHQLDANDIRSDKGTYKHFMLKEIYEQPDAISHTLTSGLQDHHLLASLIEQFTPKLKHIQNVFIVACGTSYHAGLVAKYWIESLTKLPCMVEIASEFRYREPVVPANTLMVCVSQSGETADTLAALRDLQSQHIPGFVAMALCNVETSSLVRETNLHLLTKAGPEIGVASTKAFTTQLAALLMMTLALGKIQGRMDDKQIAQVAKNLWHVPEVMSQVLELDPQIKEMSRHFLEKKHTLFLGRGIEFPIALEGALKLKEISYIHAEGYAAGELKHGPLALVDKDMPVVVLAPNDQWLDKLKSNMQEVSARGGELYVFADEQANITPSEKVHVLNLPHIDGLVAPLVYSIPVQLLSYHVAVLRGTDVDQPRNLAKSVTVE